MTNNPLITIHSRTLYGTPTECVNARDLHSFLEVGRMFAGWITNRIEQYGFEYSKDYVIVEDLSYPKRDSSKSRPQMRNDYFISLDMAKELAMVERNDKGREARRYFIECEKRLKEKLKAEQQLPEPKPKKPKVKKSHDSLEDFLNFARVIMVIENGTIVSCNPMAEDAFVTTPDKLPNQINEISYFNADQLKVVAETCLTRLARMAH